MPAQAGDVRVPLVSTTKARVLLAFCHFLPTNRHGPILEGGAASKRPRHSRKRISWIALVVLPAPCSYFVPEVSPPKPNLHLPGQVARRVQHWLQKSPVLCIISKLLDRMWPLVVSCSWGTNADECSRAACRSPYDTRAFQPDLVQAAAIAYIPHRHVRSKRE